MIVDVIVRHRISGEMLFDVIRVVDYVEPGLLKKYIRKYSEAGDVSFEIRLERGDTDES